MTIEVPDWCQIGTLVLWSDEETTGEEWVVEEITAYGVDGFFHQGFMCPEYYTKFDEWGKTVKPYDPKRKRLK